MKPPTGELASTAFAFRLFEVLEPGRTMCATRRRTCRIVVFSDNAGFALARMFQMLGESTRPLFHVVRTLEGALEAFGVESPRFELLP